MSINANENAANILVFKNDENQSCNEVIVKSEHKDDFSKTPSVETNDKTRENMVEAFTSAKIPVYKGKDPNTRKSNCCLNCSKKNSDNTKSLDKDGKDHGTVAVSLFLCKCCRCVYFCSKECQKAALPNHKSICEEIKEVEALVQKEAKKLRSKRKNDPDDWFETAQGFFWGFHETRPYMRARNRLAELLWQLAYKLETVELWEKALFHHQEWLRLCSNDNLTLRFRFPFILLYLNRDDDAFSFCCHWTNLYLTEDFDGQMSLHAGSREGQWIYPREKGCRYKDFFAECPHESDKICKLEPPILLAVCIIKMRIVAAFDERKKLGILTLKQTSPEHGQMIESNRGQIQALMDRIQTTDPKMLPDIMNHPVRRKIQHHCEQGYFCDDYPRAFFRVPGSRDLLREHLASNQLSVSK